jgi:hypothetical protein
MKAAAIRFPKVRCSGNRLESPRLRLKAILEERFSRQQLRIARQLYRSYYNRDGFGGDFLTRILAAGCCPRR